ncbi:MULTISPECIES: hypothetical protein [unclassified Mesorhizobium]|nr:MULTISPECIES: hypothetical protein [unclassified Mesorhizobium]
MVKSWNDTLNTPGINGIKPSPRLSFGTKFVAAQRKREGLKP